METSVMTGMIAITMTSSEMINVIIEKEATEATVVMVVESVTITLAETEELVEAVEKEIAIITQMPTIQDPVLQLGV